MKYLFCQCKKKPSRTLKLFANAQKKLNAELDIMEIVKVNRLCRLFFMINTKPREREMVKFFDEYTLHASDDKKSDDDFDKSGKAKCDLNVSELQKVENFEENCATLKADCA